MDSTCKSEQVLVAIWYIIVFILFGWFLIQMHVKAVTIEIDEREKNPRFLYWHLSLFLSEKLNTDCFTYINNLKA